MKKINNAKYLIFNLFLLFPNVLFSQKQNPDSKEVISVAKNQHTIDLEPFGIGYSYAHKISNRTLLGAGLQFGFGIRQFLNMPKYLYKSNCDTTVCPTPYVERRTGFLSPTLEVFRIQLFYRRVFKHNVNIEIGGYFSQSNLGGFPDIIMVDNNNASVKNIGIITSVFYGWEKVKIGQRIQFGNIHRNYDENVSKNIPSILLSSIIIQIFI